jgi:hypothetical protein
MFQYELISNLRVSPQLEFNLHSSSPVDYNINSHIYTFIGLYSEK